MSFSRRKFIATGLAFIGTSALFVTAAEAMGQIFGRQGLAIRGYDPVAYFKVSKPVKGKKEFRTKHKGATWAFASQENLDDFVKSPDKFTPVYGGYCSWAMSQGRLATTVPQAWDIVGGKLYLNFSLGIRKKWRTNIPKHIRLADKKWPTVRKKLS
ncbi:MAG: YHS domain-containing (seleno)protein [Hyphomicrobiales bacterium]